MSVCLSVCLSVASVTMCEHDCQPFLSKKFNPCFYTKNIILETKHLFQSFYACKIKKLRHHTFPFFLLSTHNRKEKALSRACHHWWCFALLIGLFVCCIFSQEEKDYSSSSSKWLFLNTSRNSSISSFEFGFIIFTDLIRCPIFMSLYAFPKHIHTV